jgi:hypothetical protein
MDSPLQNRVAGLTLPKCRPALKLSNYPRATYYGFLKKV